MSLMESAMNSAILLQLLGFISFQPYMTIANQW